MTKKNEKAEFKTFGQDLKSQFRLETGEEYLKKILKSDPSVEERDGSLFLRQLIIVPAYSKIEDSFACSMELYDSSGLIHKCDRQKIYLKLEEYQDPFGHRRKRAIDTNIPCPVAGTLSDCPHKCSKSGHLYFYVPALLSAGLNRLGCLSVHSYSDLIGIARKLHWLEQQFGNIKTPPFPSPQTFNLIPYKLSRQEIKIKRPITSESRRTGKKASSSTWAVQLEVLPEWLCQWQNYQRLAELKKLGFSGSASLIRQIYDLESREVKDRPLLPFKKITAQQGKELKELLKKSNWTPRQFLEALSALGREKITDLSVEEFEQFKKILDRSA